MSEQHFHNPVDKVAGRDINIYPPSGNRLQLGPLKWVQKEYWFGLNVTSGWLYLLLFLIFSAVALTSMVWAVRGLITHQYIGPYNVLPQSLFLAFLGVTASLGGHVHQHGFVYVPGTLTGFGKDGRGHVFMGKLGGEGVLCPKCNARLKFHQVGFHVGLRCNLNSAHAWQFDPTEVIG